MTPRRPRTTSASLEIDRIIGLPVVHPITEAEVAAFSRLEVQARFFEAGFRLKPQQAAALLAWDTFGGLFAPIPVGDGKTLVGLMLAQRHYRAGGRATLLLVPPEVFTQLTKRDIPWARQRVDLSVPFIMIGGKSREDRALAARSGKRGCYIMPHSCMSTVDSSDLLTWIRPDLIIVDEAQKFRNTDVARTKRLTTYIDEHQPKFVPLSGTMTSKSVKDYHHHILAALRESAPLPLSGYLMLQWSVVLDADADPSGAQLGPVAPLVAWARKTFPSVVIPQHIQGFREAYRLRLRTTPGVVGEGVSELKASLLYKNEPVAKPEFRPGWADLKEKMRAVEEDWISPSGDELTWAFHVWKHRWELSGGIFYRLVWPTPEELIERRGMTSGEATAMLEMAKKHHKARALYHSELRKWFGQGHRPGLDTPMLVGKSMSIHQDREVGAWLYSFWLAAKDLEVPGMPERDSIPVRVCDFKVNDAVEWAKAQPKDEGRILWYHHQEVGKWLAERAREADLDVLHCPAGPEFNDKITDLANRKKLIVASQTAHGTGKNLQHFCEQTAVQFPRQADAAEQLAGRMHRTGQESDGVLMRTNRTLEFDHENFAACINDALYMHQTIGTRQKLIYGDFDPMPQLKSSHWLQERGFRNRILTAEEDRALREHFGQGV